jgi:ATP-dependent RNA helicase DDX46/PRP5
MLEKLKQENNKVMAFDEDDDKFIMNFEKEEEEAESFLDKEKRRNERKDAKLVNQLLDEYEKINKNLYIETKEIAKMTDKEVSEFKKNNGDIKVRGLKCPKPIMNWYQCGLPDKVLEVIERKQFEKPFPI